jgi:hypothetical protein
MPDVGASGQGIPDLWHQQRAISSSFIPKSGSLGVMVERPSLTPPGATPMWPQPSPTWHWCTKNSASTPTPKNVDRRGGDLGSPNRPEEVSSPQGRGQCRSKIHLGKPGAKRHAISPDSSVDPPRFIDTDYYSPELKLILAREYRERNGGMNMIKYHRIYPLKR